MCERGELNIKAMVADMRSTERWYGYAIRPNQGRQCPQSDRAQPDKDYLESLTPEEKARVLELREMIE